MIKSGMVRHESLNLRILKIIIIVTAMLNYLVCCRVKNNLSYTEKKVHNITLRHSMARLGSLVLLIISRFLKELSPTITLITGLLTIGSGLFSRLQQFAN